MSDQQRGAVEIIDPGDGEWPWPEYPKGAPRNYLRPHNQAFTGWEGDYLEGLASSGVNRAACAHARVSDRVVEWRKKKDPAFKTAMAQAMEMATDALVFTAFQRAVHGVTRTKRHYYKGKLLDTETITEYSDDLLWKLIKARRPQEFGDRVDHNYNITVLRAEAERVALEMGLDPEAVYEETLRLANLSK